MPRGVSRFLVAADPGFRASGGRLQLVKGRIEPGENARAAALRELAEEAGIADMAIASDLGTWHSEHKGHIWSFQLCTFTKLPETWTHHCPTMAVTTSNSSGTT